MKAFSVAAALVLACAGTPVQAEMLPIETIGSWQLAKDVDPIFGDLGFRLNLIDTASGGASTLSLLCSFEEGGTVTYSIQLASPAIDFNAAVMGKIGSLLKYDNEDIRDAEWLVTSGASFISYSSGGANYIADKDNAQFEEAVRAGDAGKGGQLGEMLALGMLANGIQMFFWHASVSDQLALGFGTGTNRRSMLFDLKEGAAAIERLLTACDLPAAEPDDAPSPREQAPWGTMNTTQDEYKTIGLDPQQCLELHPVKHRRGDPLTVADVDNPGAVLTASADTDPDIVIEGPKRQLKVYFGENYSAGRFQYRSWDRRAETCSQD